MVSCVFCMPHLPAQCLSYSTQDPYTPPLPSYPDLGLAHLWPACRYPHPPGVSTFQTQQDYTSQVLQPEEALYLRKKKKRPVRQDPYARFSALLYRRPPREDRKAILASMDNMDPDHATLLWHCGGVRLHSSPKMPQNPTWKTSSQSKALLIPQHQSMVLSSFFKINWKLNSGYPMFPKFYSSAKHLIWGKQYCVLQHRLLWNKCSNHLEKDPSEVFIFYLIFILQYSLSPL